MSGLQLVQTLNSTPFVFLWLFHHGSWDLPFLRKGLGVIKAVRARTGGSRPLQSQNRRDAAPNCWKGGRKEEEQGAEAKHPDAAVARLLPQRAGTLVGRGGCVLPVCWDEAKHKDKLCALRLFCLHMATDAARLPLDVGGRSRMAWGVGVQPWGPGAVQCPSQWEQRDALCEWGCSCSSACLVVVCVKEINFSEIFF